MIRQKDLIHNTDWDILIILDACRYDVFKEVYKEVLGVGELKKVKSPASWTFGWFVDTFYKMPKLKDVAFVSASPSVNSDKIDIVNKEKRKKYGDIDFDAEDYFKKVINVSETGFNRDYGIVFPEEVTSEVIRLLNSENCKVMCKYYQVHDPYLYFIYKGETEKVNVSNFEERDKVVLKFDNFKTFLSNFISDTTLWKIRKLIRKPPKEGLGYLWLNNGTEGIRNAYREDMKEMMSHIKEILKHCKGKTVVITSDHGENLGEKGYFGHGARRTKEVEEVPWLVIDA